MSNERPNNKNTNQAGKGSKPRPCDLEIYGKNYELIEWRDKGSYCCECGISFMNNAPRKYNLDGSAQCINGCNYN